MFISVANTHELGPPRRYSGNAGRARGYSVEDPQNPHAKAACGAPARDDAGLKAGATVRHGS
jgi:hypothetical protein